VLGTRLITGASLVVLASCTCEGDAPRSDGGPVPVEEPSPGQRVAVRLLDELGAARITLGPAPEVTAGPRTVIEHAAGAPFEEPWVALDGGGRPVRTEEVDEGTRLLESACTVLPALPYQDLALEAEIAPDRPGPRPGPGQQHISGLPLVVELDEMPPSTGAGCRIEFLVSHTVEPHQATGGADDDEELRSREVSCTTAGATRAVAIVLATGLVTGFTGRTNVVQQSEATAWVGGVRLIQRRIGGLTLAEVRERYGPDPLVAPDAAEVRVKPSLSQQLRDAVLAPPGTSICWPASALRVEPGAALRFAPGVAWQVSASPARPVAFRVRSGQDVLFEQERRPDQEGWTEENVPLDALAGGGELCFETSAADGEGALWSVWGTPEVVVPDGVRQERPRTIVLVSIDTLRADRLGLYGYQHPTSPVLDELARSSLVFENHIAQTGWTLPSHVSMLTGLSPEAHGVAAQMDRPEDVLEAGFDPTTPTLAGSLRALGYTTHGIASGPYLDPVFGFDRGFDTYDFVAHDASATNAHEGSYRDLTSGRVVARAQRVLREAGGRPVFLFLHFWDVHFDYIPTREDLAAVHPQRAAQDIDYADVGHPYTGHLNPALFLLVAVAGPQRGPLEFYRRVHELLPRFPWVQERMTVLSDLYDGEVHTVDRHLGHVLEELRRRGRSDAVVVVTGDHGEAFMEHGTLGHGMDNIHREGLVVPLLIRAPGLVEPGRRISPSTTRDISATILDLAGAGTLAGGQGRSLRVDPGPDTLALGHDGSFSRIQATLGTRRLLVWGRFGEDQVFDIVGDPLERTDIGDREQETRAALRRAVARYLLAEGRGAHVAVCGDEDITPFELSLGSDAALRPIFVYGPPDSGRIEQLDEDRTVRVRAFPARGEIVALTSLVPDSADVRITVARGAGASVSGRIAGVDGSPLPSEVVLAGGAAPARPGALPPNLCEEPGRVFIWRTSAGQVRRRFQPDEETMEQLRALGYIRGPNTTP
jgi:arylsulfatase A-like enzyme